MDDTKSLLMMVLHKMYQDKPKNVEQIFQLIHNFNNGKIEKNHYEKTLKKICDLTCERLPSPILVYILTLVDMPEGYDNESQIIQKMRATHNHLPEMNVRPHLLEYLNNVRSSCKQIVTKNRSETTLKPQRLLRRPRKLILKRPEPMKSLLDICASYVIKNEDYLKQMYKSKQKQVWKVINSNLVNGQDLEQCYTIVKDLNKKNRLLREIESNNISLEILMEEYQDSDILLKISSKEESRRKRRDPFEISPEFKAQISEIFQFNSFL